MAESAPKMSVAITEGNYGRVPTVPSLVPNRREREMTRIFFV